MKKYIFLAFSLLFVMAAAIALGFFHSFQSATAKPDQGMTTTGKGNGIWKTVDSLVAQGLPQSALDLVNAYIPETEKKGDMPEFLKASIYQLRLRSDFEENFIEKYIGETEKNLSLKAEPARQVLNSMLAELYWQYYQQNRYRILDQTVVQNDQSTDMATWDARRFVEKVSQLYHASLANAGLLQSVSLKGYDPILETAEGSKKFRPTLYDFLAHRAIDFFMNDEASVTRPIRPFTMQDPGLLTESVVFTELTIQTSDTLSFHYQALKITQAVEKFHSGTGEPLPLMDAALKRLDFVRTNGNVKSADSLYLATLLRLEEKYRGNAVAADVIEKIASFWQGKEENFDAPGGETGRNYIIAREWCLKAIGQYPGSDGAKNCRIILNSIEAPSLSITLGREVMPGREFPLLVNFRNTRQLWFRLIELNYDEHVNVKQELYSERSAEKYLKLKSLKEWNILLPETGDYKNHSIEAIHPATEAGYHLLIVSSNSAFDPKNSPVAMQDFWSSALSYVNRRNTDGSGVFRVLNRETGEPVKDVKIQTFTREYNYRTRSNERKNGDIYHSDAEGMFLVKSAGERNYRNLSFDFSLGNDRLVAENYFSPYRDSRQKTGEKTRTFLFTDRSIYRPGQTIYFKGIVVGTEEDNNRILTGNQSVVSLFDANGREISSLEVTSNKYGSFSGSFVLPVSGPGGQYRIDNKSGSSYFNVEEYKRPKFEVEFMPVKGSYRLNEQVTVPGRAESYTGVPVSGALVSYRVVRSVSWPFFRFGWGFYPFHRPESEIANGTLLTEPDGTFSISFTAVPDPQAQLKNNPLFTYTIYSDVTDINGETRSATTVVQVSNKALLAELLVPEIINREAGSSYKLSTTNLNGEKTPVEVSVEVFALKEPARFTRPRLWEAPDTAVYSREEFIRRLPSDVYLNEEKTPGEKGKSVFRKNYHTSTDSVVSFAGLDKWEPGRYLISLSAVDAFGERVTVDRVVRIISPDSKKAPANEALWAYLLTPAPKAGETIRLLTASALKNARLYFEVMMQEQSVHRERIKISQAQAVLSYKIPETFTGEIKISLTLVYDNRSYHYSTAVTIPDSRNQLNVAFETFRSPLLPGGTEKWKLKITDPDEKPLNAELLAGMYDASLDAILPHNWYFNLSERRYNNPEWETRNAFASSPGYTLPGQTTGPDYPVIRSYDALNWFGYGMYGGFQRFAAGRSAGMMKNMQESMPEAMAVAPTADDADGLISDQTPAEPGTGKQAEPPQIRRNLNETAFFYPHLTTNAEGEVWVEFTVPEALTRWNFMGLAHTEGLRYGLFSKEVVTRKELMVTPNLPRFFREGDKMTLQTKVSSLVENPVQGTARLELFDALTMSPVDAVFGNNLSSKPFELEPAGNTVVEWEIAIPEGMEAVMVRITAVAGNHSDGEEVMLPVLTNRMLVTETLPLPVNGNESRSFEFSKLINQPGGSQTLRNHRLTLEFTSNPAWYAVQALPYLAEQTTENSDAVFNRLYANSLASYIANSSPKIRAVFETWKNLSPDALLSNLEKNQELKALVLDETPWLMEGKNESEQKQRIALMFDVNRMASMQEAAKQQLQQMQSANGGWPWFEGMPESRYITQLVMTGFGRLHYLKVMDLKQDQASLEMISRANSYLNMRLIEDYTRIMKDHPKDYDKLHPGQEHLQYLFATSYLQDVIRKDDKASDALAYFGKQARKYWTSQGLYAQGMIALWAGRSGDLKTANAIMKSLLERAITHPELGMYWRDNRGGHFWHQAPVETQALLIELFEELGNDPKAVDQMKTWLLKQKQTQRWATSRATADAVYALLLRGGDWLQTGSGLNVTLGGKPVEMASRDNQPEAGTGYVKTIWQGSEIQPEMGKIVVSKSTAGPAWGAMYWQYFENLDKISGHDSPLKISSRLYIKSNTDAGPVLEEISGDNPLRVGRQVVVRLELRTDRDLEFVHLKSMRAAGFEPVNNLSGYRWNGGLGYYENTRDAASNFFFNYLPKGTWVFEYTLTAAQKGIFSNGINIVQCLYAPEFSAHSEGISVEIR